MHGHSQRCLLGRGGAFETMQQYFVEEEVVGRKEQPRSVLPQQEARLAAAVLRVEELLATLTTANQTGLQNDFSLFEPPLLFPKPRGTKVTPRSALPAM